MVYYYYVHIFLEPSTAGIYVWFIITTYILYENIDQILLNKSHGPKHYKICDTCAYKVFYTLL